MRFIRGVDVLTPFLIAIVVFIVFFKAGLVQADSTNYLNTTVKISICGDTVVEGPEDCEVADLNGKTCALLDYLGGDLTCDIACSFITSGCTPKPSPTPTATPAASSSTSSTSSTGSSSNSTNTTTSFIPAFLVDLFRRTALPLLLQNFDPNGDGKITADELAMVASSWVNGWTSYINSGFSETQNCDINRDGVCDLKDFSILLFYTGR